MNSRLRILFTAQTFLKSPYELPHESLHFFQRHFFLSCILQKEQKCFLRRNKPYNLFFVKPIHLPKQTFDTVAGNGVLEIALGGTHHNFYRGQRRGSLHLIPAPVYQEKTHTQPGRERKMLPFRKKTRNKPLFVQPFVFGQGGHSLYFLALLRLLFLSAITAMAAALLAATLFSIFLDGELLRLCILAVADFFLLLAAGSGS